MANAIRYRSGRRQYQQFAISGSYDVDVGDLMYLDGGVAYPASHFTWDTSLGVTQTAFAKQFIGIAAQQCRAGVPATIDIDTSPDAVYEFPIASATYENGDAFGPAKASGNALEDQKLEGSTNSEVISIARAVDRKTAADTFVKVQFASAYNASSANVGAGLGS